MPAYTLRAPCIYLHASSQEIKQKRLNIFEMEIYAHLVDLKMDKCKVEGILHFISMLVDKYGKSAICKRLCCKIVFVVNRTIVCAAVVY